MPAVHIRWERLDAPGTDAAKLLLLTLWPVQPYETLIHPDGTGLTEQHFSAYFDERYAKDRQRQAQRREDRTKPDGPRKHHWTVTEILWTYRYTMIAAIHTSQQQFGEAPVLIPLLRKALTMLDVRELGGDKAYDANYIYQFAKQHGIEAQIKVRDTGFPSYSHSGKKYRKAHMLAARLDPEGLRPRRTAATMPRPATTPSRPSSATRSTARALKPSAAKSCACASPTT